MASAEVNLGRVVKAPARARRWAAPSSFSQVFLLMRHQLKEYLTSRRLVVLLGIVAVMGVIISAIVAIYRPSYLSDSLSFYYQTWSVGINTVVVATAVILGGDAIAGEFQNKTGYFLMGQPLRRATIYAGKYLAAFVSSLGILAFFFLIFLGNGVAYFGVGALPWQYGASLLLAIVYLAAVLGTTFLFSSLFKTSAYGFVITAVLFLVGFSILQLAVVDLWNTEPWYVISYTDGVIGNVLLPNIPWGFSGEITKTISRFGPTTGNATVTYTPGIGEGVVVMLAYFLVTTIVGLILFEREEFS